MTLKCATGLKIQKDQSGAGIRRKVAQGVEHGVAQVIGDAKGPVVENGHEPRVAATVRGIHTHVSGCTLATKNVSALVMSVRWRGTEPLSLF